MCHLLIQSNKSHLMQNFLRTCAPRREKLMFPRKSSQPLNISELLSDLIPVKYKDLGCPTIACTIRQTEISHALLDLGESINLLSFLVYQQLGLGDLSPTRVTIQLADRSVKVSKGKINDVLSGSGSLFTSLISQFQKHNLCLILGLKLLLSQGDHSLLLSMPSSIVGMGP